MAAAVLAAGCATTGDRYGAPEAIGAIHSFKKEYIKTDLSKLTAFCNFTRPGSKLTVYIEGDGSAWRSRHELSDDPTPRHQLMLILATMDPSENVAYLARPGQLTEERTPDCDSEYWAERRFSREVVNAMNSAIDRLKTESRAKEISLVGFSGGAAIAVIIAAGRSDVASIRTIAGCLDCEAVCKYHNATPLEGSLNPIDFADKVSHIPQRHFVGDRDDIVPVFVIESFAGRIGDKTRESVTVVPGASHLYGWKKAWPSLLALPLYKKT